LSNIINAPLEINLFYHKEGRIEAITKILRKGGANKVLGIDETKMVEIKEISSNRRKVDQNGINIADVVFVPLEDGDRTEALKKIEKSERGEYELTDAVTLLAEDKKVKLKKIKDFWLDLGNPDDIEKIEEFLDSLSQKI